MDITEIVSAVLTLIVALVSAFLIPMIKAKVSKEKLEKANQLITVAVGAAEQLYNSKEGQEKKDYVLAYLETQGINIDAETIEVLIENAVLRLHSELNEK